MCAIVMPAFLALGSTSIRTIRVFVMLGPLIPVRMMVMVVCVAGILLIAHSRRLPAGLVPSARGRFAANRGTVTT